MFFNFFALSSEASNTLLRWLQYLALLLAFCFDAGAIGRECCSDELNESGSISGYLKHLLSVGMPQLRSTAL